MPTRVRDSSPERRRERRERKDRDRKEKDLDSRERDKERDRDRRPKPSSSSSSSSSSKPHRTTSAKEKSSSRTSLSSTDSKRRSSMPGVIEEEHDGSNDSKSNLPYPSFSRAHSKEAVGPSPVNLDVFTPPSTDINASKEKLATLNRIINGGAPPSPPLTDKTAGRSKSSAAKPSSVETIIEEDRKEDAGRKSPSAFSARLSKSNSHPRSSSDQGLSPAPIISRKESSGTPLKDVVNGVAAKRSVSQPIATTKIAPKPVAVVESTTEVSSDGTSIAPEQPDILRPGSKIPPLAVLDDDVQSQVTSVHETGLPQQQTPLNVVILDSAYNTPSSQGGPPPPPPPPHIPVSVPRVDYLLQHGGLPHNVPKNLLYAGKPMAVQQGPLSPSQNPVVVANLFEPYTQLLADFEAVIQKNGSLAVATGYRSVARRLLDRLEAVFARDISSEYCSCCMCRFPNESDVDNAGVSWGEILELVSGRRELPSWPPFSISAAQQGLGISVSLEQQLQTPFQKLDIDVPEEYREHYIRQSRKTKQSVDKWLARNSSDQIATSSPPEEVDDETLTFAMLTHLPSDQRALFKDMLGIVDKPTEPPRRAPSPEHRDSNGHPPARSAPTPAPQPRARPDYIVSAGQAIQRLYRLSSVPRDPETAIYLLNNPTLHNPLATLAAISSDEWDILISGRFDGFLRSGAEDVGTDFPPPHANARHTSAHVRLPSRGATPAYGPTSTQSRQNSYGAPYVRPASAPGHAVGGQGARSGAPIALDEETEIATLAEIERDIYTGMEALEDAFEQLHLKAEAVRRALRERNAGLAAAAQRRRSQAVEVRTTTPAAGLGRDNAGPINGSGFFRPLWETETDDGLGDDVSELAPDDSASNISSVRKRRHKGGGKSRRRDERRTPVVGPIDEDDEGSELASSPRKVG